MGPASGRRGRPAWQDTPCCVTGHGHPQGRPSLWPSHPRQPSRVSVRGVVEPLCAGWALTGTFTAHLGPGPGLPWAAARAAPGGEGLVSLLGSAEGWAAPAPGTAGGFGGRRGRERSAGQVGGGETRLWAEGFVSGGLHSPLLGGHAWTRPGGLVTAQARSPGGAGRGVPRSPPDQLCCSAPNANDRRFRLGCFGLRGAWGFPPAPPALWPVLAVFRNICKCVFVLHVGRGPCPPTGLVFQIGLGGRGAPCPASPWKR